MTCYENMSFYSKQKIQNINKLFKLILISSFSVKPRPFPFFEMLKLIDNHLNRKCYMVRQQPNDKQH